MTCCDQEPVAALWKCSSPTARFCCPEIGLTRICLSHMREHTHACIQPQNQKPTHRNLHPYIFPSPAFQTCNDRVRILVVGKRYCVPFQFPSSTIHNLCTNPHQLPSCTPQAPGRFPACPAPAHSHHQELVLLSPGLAFQTPKGSKPEQDRYHPLHSHTASLQL